MEIPKAVSQGNAARAAKEDSTLCHQEAEVRNPGEWKDLG